MYKQKIKKGISLIVLIITVIIMIIIASSVILLVNDSGLVKNANKAVKASDSAIAKEIVVMAKSEWRTNLKEIQKKGFKTFKAYAESMLAEKGFNIGNNAGEFIVSDNGLLYEYKVPVIPNGFVASSVESEDEVSEGLVIYEGREKVTGKNVETAKTTRNQFVWVPVPNINEFGLKEGYSNGKLQKYISLEEVSEPALRSILELLNSDIETGEYAEYNAMKASIEKYGGFYIGRYEIGKEIIDGIETIISKKDVLPWTNISWGENMVSIGTEGAVAKSRGMYNDKYEFKSHLLYGTEWDAIMRFIDDDSIMVNSSAKGNYINYNESVDETKKINGSGTIKETGSSEEWKLKNIYDLAGNVREWTMEAYHGELIGRTTRGGTANMTGFEQPISNRLPNIPSHNEEGLGFRVALYLK